MLATLRRYPTAIRALSASASSRPTAFTGRNLSSIKPSASSFHSVVRPSTASFHNFTRVQQQAHAYASAQSGETVDEPLTKFEDLRNNNVINENVLRAITRDMRLETMTEVQSKTLQIALSGVDVAAQAKTGTGKTLGFLLPLLQNILLKDPSLANRPSFRSAESRASRPTSRSIRAIVISPTRELAEQIAAEAKRITAYTGIVTQVAVGGTQKGMHLRQMRHEGCHLLVGTPGRMNDILSDPDSGVAAPELDCLVMDEADRLLEAGFQKEIDSIKRAIPDPRDRERQNLMFSATLPREVVSLVRQTLRPGFQFIKCINENEVPTHERVPQKMVVTNGLENQMPALIELCTAELKKSESGGRPFKAIVFCNTTANVTLAYQTFNAIRRMERDSLLSIPSIFQLHSKLTQSARTDKTQRFRNSESGILFASDVASRGMDFPDVTHVIQMGPPRQREDYIHRIGRTGRAGKEGEAWLIVSGPEQDYAESLLHGLPLQNNSDLQTAGIDMTQPGEIPAAAATILKNVVEACQKLPAQLMSESYRSAFSSASQEANKQEAVNSLNKLALFGWGMEKPPFVSPVLASKLGLSRVKGLNFERESSYDGTNFADLDSEDYLPRRGARSGDRGGFDRGQRGHMNSGGRPSFNRARGSENYDRRSSGGYAASNQHSYRGRGRY